jgi:small membrane protein
MTAIQVFLIATALAFLVLTALAITKKKTSVVHGGFWVAVWAIAIVVVYNPELANTFANKVGVGRGVDAILYVVVFFLLYTVFRLFVRIERTEANITKLSQHIAILSAGDDEKR